MNKRIKGVIFDVSGVLWLGLVTELRLHSGVHELIAKKLGITIDQYFDSIDTIYAKSIIGEINEKKALSIMAKNLKTTPSKLKSLYMREYKRHFILNKSLISFAEGLKKKGYKIAILSDQWPVSKESFIIKKFYKIFNPVLVSCDIQTRKPNPKAYKLALKKLKIRPEQSIFIDNQIWNIKPARKLGMHAILFKNNKQVIKELNGLLK